MQTKRILSIILTLVMALGLLAIAPITASADSVVTVNAGELDDEIEVLQADYTAAQGTFPISLSGGAGGPYAVEKVDGNKKINFKFNQGVTNAGNIIVEPGLGVGFYPVTFLIRNDTKGNIDGDYFYYIIVITNSYDNAAIFGPEALTLLEGYEQQTTKKFSISGAPSPTLEVETGSAFIDWDEKEQRLVIKTTEQNGKTVGLTEGEYPVEFTATNVVDGETKTATHTFTLTVEVPIPPSITGPEALTLIEGYEATSSEAFAVAGHPAPVLTVTSSNESIVWNKDTGKLDIKAELPIGEYTVTFKAVNKNAVNKDVEALHTFTLTVAEEPSGNEEPEKGIFGTNAKWYGEWWHYVLFFLAFGFIWMWF